MGSSRQRVTFPLPVHRCRRNWTRSPTATELSDMRMCASVPSIFMTAPPRFVGCEVAQLNEAATNITIVARILDTLLHRRTGGPHDAPSLRMLNEIGGSSGDK